MKRTVLDKEEGRWFARNVTKTKFILESAAKKDPGILERQTYRTLLKLERQAAEMTSVLEQLKDEPFEFELNLERKEKLVLRDMISNTSRQIEERILPEYERRYPSLVGDTKAKLKLLKAMEKKFK